MVLLECSVSWLVLPVCGSGVPPMPVLLGTNNYHNAKPDDEKAIRICARLIPGKYRLPKNNP